LLSSTSKPPSRCRGRLTSWCFCSRPLSRSRSRPRGQGITLSNTTVVCSCL
jgi:hypothetical protein